MWQFDMVFIQTLNKFCTAIENIKDIQFINSIYNQQPPNNLLFLIYFFTNKLVQKHNENVFTNTLSHTFIFKTMDINHGYYLTNFQIIWVKLQVYILYFI